MSKNTKSGIAVFIIILLIAGGCIGYAFYAKKNQTQNKKKETMYYLMKKSKIA